SWPARRRGRRWAGWVCGRSLPSAAAAPSQWSSPAYGASRWPPRWRGWAAPGARGRWAPRRPAAGPRSGKGPRRGRAAAGARRGGCGGAAVRVAAHPRPDRLLAALRAENVTRVSVLIAAQSGSRTAQAIAPVRNRIAVDAVVTPAAPPGTIIRAGPFTITVRA